MGANGAVLCGGYTVDCGREGDEVGRECKIDYYPVPLSLFSLSLASFLSPIFTTYYLL